MDNLKNLLTELYQAKKIDVRLCALLGAILDHIKEIEEDVSLLKRVRQKELTERAELFNRLIEPSMD